MKKLFFTIAIVLSAGIVSSVSAQQKLNETTVSGKVISFEESFALEGVFIKVKDAEKTSGTQADGTFSIALGPTDKVLVFKFDGYQTVELPVTEQKDYEVILKRANTP